LGVAYSFKGEVKKVFSAGEALLEYGQSHASIRSLVLGHQTMMLGHTTDGDFQSAIECGTKGIEVSADPWYTQSVNAFITIPYIMNNQFQEAKNISQQLITFSDKFGVEAFVPPSKMNLGAVLMAEGRMEQGLKMIEGVQRLFLESGAKLLYAHTEYTLGHIYLQMVEKSVPIKLTTVIKNIGFLVKNVPFAGKKAANHLNKAIEVYREIGSKGWMGMSYLDLGLLHRAKGEKNRARECLSTAIKLFEQCELEKWLRQAREALASLR
jgi:tetratricopeptide (TPR) repeat protein